MKKPRNRFFNRELSWLEFNQRVLDQASNPAFPLLERLKFLAITASNLDEFFMVRVGSLQFLEERNPDRRDPSGLTASQQLNHIGRRVRRMMRAQAHCSAHIGVFAALFNVAFLGLPFRNQGNHRM